MSGSACSAELIVFCAPAASLRSTCSTSSVPPASSIAVCGAGAAGVEAGVADLLVDADHLRRPFLGEAGAGTLAGHRLVLADVGEGADLLVDVGAGVDRDDRDPGIGGRGERVLQRVVVGHRDDQAVRVLGDGGIDELAHLHHVERRRRAVVDGRARHRRGVVDALLDHRPERIGCLTVGDDLDREVAALDEVDRVLRATGSVPPARSVPAGAAAVPSPVVASLIGVARRRRCRRPRQSCRQPASAHRPRASAPATRNLVFM